MLGLAPASVALHQVIRCVKCSVPVRRHLQAQRRLHLQQTSVLHDDSIHLLAQLLLLHLQTLHVLLQKQEVKQEKGSGLK